MGKVRTIRRRNGCSPESAQSEFPSSGQNITVLKVQLSYKACKLTQSLKEQLKFWPKGRKMSRQPRVFFWQTNTLTRQLARTGKFSAHHVCYRWLFKRWNCFFLRILFLRQALRFFKIQKFSDWWQKVTKNWLTLFKENSWLILNQQH